MMDAPSSLRGASAEGLKAALDEFDPQSSPPKSSPKSKPDPEAKPEAKPKAKRKYTRRKNDGMSKSLTPEQKAFLTSPLAPTVFAGLYAGPFHVVESLFPCPRGTISPSKEAIEAGGNAMLEVAKIFGGEFLKWVPVVHLAFCYAADGTGAVRRYREWRTEARAAANAPVPGADAA